MRWVSVAPLQMLGHRTGCYDMPGIHDILVRVFALDADAQLVRRTRKIVVDMVEIDVIFISSELVRLIVIRLILYYIIIRLQYTVTSRR